MNIFASSNLADPQRNRLIVIAGAIAGGAILLAFAHGLASGAVAQSSLRNLRLALHLLSRSSGPAAGSCMSCCAARGRIAPRARAGLGGLMILAALSSFGLHGMTGGLSLIHLLSALVLVMIPRGIVQARRSNLAAHRRTMSLTFYLGLSAAGLFTLLPERMLGSWLFG